MTLAVPVLCLLMLYARLIAADNGKPGSRDLSHHWPARRFCTTCRVACLYTAASTHLQEKKAFGRQNGSMLAGLPGPGIWREKLADIFVILLDVCGTAWVKFT